RGALLALASPPILAAMRVINLAGSWRLLLPGSLLLLVAFPRAREQWYIWVGLMIVAPATEGTVKILVGRPRPEAASMGFPSGHATAAAAFFGAVFYLAESLRPPARRLVRTAALVIIVLVATARVMLRAHWPTDALGGIALGLTLASAAAPLALPRGRPTDPRACTGSGFRPHEHATRPGRFQVPCKRSGVTRPASLPPVVNGGGGF